ncbi:MAG: hypothetical protein AAFX92_03865 [Pseudomonadota bacterium]
MSEMAIRRNTVPVRENPAPWLLTGLGRRVDLLDPTPDQIDWRDIYGALIEIPRFTGHRCRWRMGEPWSVAAHLVLGAFLEGQDTYDRIPALGYAEIGAVIRRGPLAVRIHACRLGLSARRQKAEIRSRKSEGRAA